MVALSKFFPPLVLEIQLKLSFILLVLGLVNILVPERVDGDRETLLRILGLLPLPESGKGASPQGSIHHQMVSES